MALRPHPSWLPFSSVLISRFALAGVFVEQAEGISVEELQVRRTYDSLLQTRRLPTFHSPTPRGPYLQYKLRARPDADDDYASRLQKMKGQLLDWQQQQQQQQHGQQQQQQQQQQGQGQGQGPAKGR